MKQVLKACSHYIGHLETEVKVAKETAKDISSELEEADKIIETLKDFSSKVLKELSEWMPPGDFKVYKDNPIVKEFDL